MPKKTILADFESYNEDIPVATVLEVGQSNRFGDSRKSNLLDRANSEINRKKDKSIHSKDMTKSFDSPTSATSQNRILNSEVATKEVKLWPSQLKEKIVKTFTKKPNIEKANVFFEKHKWPPGLREAVWCLFSLFFRSLIS